MKESCGSSFGSVSDVEDVAEEPLVSTIGSGAQEIGNSRLKCSESPDALYQELNSSLGILDRAMMLLLRCGRIPEHVAFIMDGNRRFARGNAIATSEGHSKGFERMMQVLFWCQLLGVREITVYAFSIENFKRSPEEVSTLLDTALERCWAMIKQKEALRRLGVGIRVVGRLDMFPKDLQVGLKQLMEATENDRVKITLNVAMAYTSREEITSAIRTAANAVRDGHMEPEDITETTLDDCMYVRSKVDLLVRTSGEVRLSDFMLWQSTSAMLSFTPVLWPEFSFRNLCSAVFWYQVQCNQIKGQSEEGACP